MGLGRVAGACAVEHSFIPWPSLNLLRRNKSCKVAAKGERLRPRPGNRLPAPDALPRNSDAIALDPGGCFDRAHGDHAHAPTRLGLLDTLRPLIYDALRSWTVDRAFARSFQRMSSGCKAAGQWRRFLMFRPDFCLHEPQADSTVSVAARRLFSMQEERR